MPNFGKLNDARRLTPWSSAEHDAFVSAHYGSLLSEPAVAEAYVQDYERKEKEFDEAYAQQGEMLAQSSKTAGGEPQTLPAIEKIDWDPRKKFAQVKTPEEIAQEEAAKAEAKAKKDAEKAAKDAAKAEAKAAATAEKARVKAEAKAQKEAAKASKKAEKSAQ